MNLNNNDSKEEALCEKSSSKMTSKKTSQPKFHKVPARPDDEEENVAQECAFFYHDIEASVASNISDASSITGISISNGKNNNFNPPFQHDETECSMPLRFLAAFRSRFHQLNDSQPDRWEDLWLDENDGENDSNDDEEAPPLHFPLTDQVAQSSLCWRQDGKVLMKLPKDKVRLLMDSQLEPGILSVRSAEQYVLTVDENLYRRVVQEMADAYTSPCGIHKFCLDEGKVSIRVAILLLIIILIFLLVNTIIWPVT